MFKERGYAHFLVLSAFLLLGTMSCKKKEEVWILTGVEIVSLPVTDPSGVYWDSATNFIGDPCDSCKYPDLRIRVNCPSDYTSGFRFCDTVYNADGSPRPFIGLSMTLRKEEYTFELCDLDETWLGSSLDTISQGNFEPYTSGYNGIITAHGSNGSIIDFHYQVEEQ